LNSLEEYIANLKVKLNESAFSPQFVRLANLYFINEQYDDCISVCTIGLQIFPDYLTAKVLLLKALIKLEYINEAEKVFNEIKCKLPNEDLIKQFERSISAIKGKPGQERIFYPNKINSTLEYPSYKNEIEEINRDLFANFDFDEFTDSDFTVPKEFDSAFESFCRDFGNFKFDLNESHLIKPDAKPKKENGAQSNPGSFLSKINIVTETIADIYTKQGYLKEAFDAYNLLIDNNHPNKRRIQEKLYELERNMVNGKKN
jgi:tetratricopeptide (TPR) repeat protein